MSTPTNPIMSGSPGGEPASNPPDQGGFFSRLGAGLKKVMPYVTPIANRLAAAAGNYGPMELEHQQKEQELEAARNATQQQLADSQMQTANLNRQLLSKQIENVRTPEQVNTAELAKHQTELEQQVNLTPGKEITGRTDTGSLGAFTQTNRVNPETHQLETHTDPTMVTRQVPNPEYQARQDITSGKVPPPNLVEDWNAPPTMPATIPQSHQLEVAPKIEGSKIIQSKESPTGFAYQHMDQFGNPVGQPLLGAPAPYAYVPQRTQSVRTTPKQDAQGNWVDVPESSSTVKSPAGGGAPQAPPPTLPSTGPGTPQATNILGPNGQPLHGPLGAAARTTLGQIYTTENIINSVLPELDAKVKKAGDANTIWDAGTQRLAWLEYKRLGVSPDNIDPTLAKILPIVAQLEIVGGLPYMKGTRSFQYLQQIQQHLPNPEKDSPGLMVDKIHALQKTLPMIRKGIMQAEGVEAAPQQEATPPSGGILSPTDWLNQQQKPH